MAEILPFRGTRYALEKGRGLGAVLAPPYDQVTQEKREELLRRSPHNVIHLTLGEERVGDGPGSNRYTRAAEAWRAWQEQGILVTDPAPAIYPLEQVFFAPDGRQLTRRGFLAAVRLHEFREGVIVPHEKTLAGPKADRLEILKAVRANLSPLFGLYREERGATARALARAFEREPVHEAGTDDGVHQRLWRTEDPAVIAAAQGLLKDQRILIADGHHRYETCLVYQRTLDEAEPGLPPDGSHRYVLMFLCPMSDPGLLIFPTHRLLHGLKDFDLARLLEALDRLFTIQELPESLHKAAGRAWAVSKLAEHAGGSSSFLMISAADQKAHILTLRSSAERDVAELPSNETLRALDVTVLHSVVLQHVLGLSPRSQEQQENVTFVRDAGEAVSRVLSGEHQIGFLLNPTPMWQLEAVGDAGETMPQKSTL
ncbi:MAG TPA: DUF1015 domain-containing protein, partial [Anaeromyxobacteraceae bacterium]|nr:DUF1015 domain-containing protein [Anaeromyxobacteraceae bacterium]